jgi:uncharacterized membrane protein YbhN (UPF0104 family)
MQHISSSLGRALRIAVAAILTVLIFAYVDWPGLRAALRSVQLPAVAAATAAFAGISILEAIRLRLVLRPRALPLLHAFKLHLIGSAFANVTPAQLGGDAYKIVRLGREGHELVPLSVRIASLRVLSIGIVAIVAGVTLVLNRDRFPDLLHFVDASPGLFGWLGLLLLAGAAAGVWRARGPLRRYLLRQQLKPDAGTVASLAVVSTTMLALRGVTLFFLCWSVALPIDATDALLVTSLAMLAAVVPISVAGIGIREGVIIGLLTTLSASYEQALTVALLGRALMIALGLAGICWWLVETRIGQPISD